MAASIPNSLYRDSGSFQKIVAAFLGGEGLPFAEVLSAERNERVFQKHGCLFGLHGVYTTAIMVWSFLSQVLRDGKEASCQAAVARLATACVMDLEIAPYQGKETGESALLRSMLGSLSSGDIAVMDRYYGSFMMIALLLGRGTQTCACQHHLRHRDFHRGRRLGK